jgi:FKBP-type peptidyl-prolyl cis-trans isomerase FkpA
MKTVLFFLSVIFASNDLLSQKWEDCCWEKSASGLEYKIEKPGEGKKLQRSDSVNIRWIWFDCETGEVLENSLEIMGVYKWSVGSGVFVIGFEEGFKKLKRGGTAYLKIPPKIAFGKNGLNGRKTFCYFIEVLPD